jgi:transposase
MMESSSFVGLDVHKKFIQVALISAGTDDVLEWRTPNTPSKVAAFIRKVGKLGGSRVELCYEAGPTGYGLARTLNEQAGFRCRVIAPSLIPKKPGERVKTDRRDAKKLAKYLKSGLLTEVRPPTPDEEGRRELCRARGAAKDDEKRAKQRLSKFLLRQERRFTGTKAAWTNQHLVWLEQQRFDGHFLQMTFDALLRALTQAMDRVAELERAIEEMAQDDAVREPIALLQAFKGVRLVTATCLVTELYDITRFSSPRGLMSFLGLTASEHSTGGNPNRGGITKAGNSRVRRLMTEAAWNYTRSSRTGYALRRRREGLPGWAVDLAERAQHRLHRRYWRLVNNGKHPNKAVTAVAREFAGFVWAMLVHHELDKQEAHA